MDTHEVLVAARNLIDRDGWGQGGAVKYCALGSVAAVVGDDSWVAPEPGSLARRARDELGRVVGRTPWVWNDAPGRTKAEVLAAFDKAIAATAPLPADPLDETLSVELEVVG